MFEKKVGWTGRDVRCDIWTKSAFGDSVAKGRRFPFFLQRVANHYSSFDISKG